MSQGGLVELSPISFAMLTRPSYPVLQVIKGIVIDGLLRKGGDANGGEPQELIVLGCPRYEGYQHPEGKKDF